MRNNWLAMLAILMGLGAIAFGPLHTSNDTKYLQAGLFFSAVALWMFAFAVRF